MSISLIDAKVFNGRIFKKSYDRLFNRIHTKYGETCEPFVITDKSWFMLGWSKDAEEIIIPDSFMLGKTYYQVVGVEGNAFKGFNNLKYLTITNTVVDIKYDFFVKSDFPKLEKVFIDNYANAIPCGPVRFEMPKDRHIEIEWLRGENEKDFNVNDYGIVLGFSDVGRKNYKDFYDKSEKMFENTYYNVVINSENIGCEIKGIADFAFFGEFKNAQSLSIQDVIFVGDYAFGDNDNLRYIELSESVLYLGEYCFMDCHSVENVLIPKTVEFIFNTIFYGCTSILSVSVSKDTKVLKTGYLGIIEETERNLIMYDNYTDTNRFIMSV